MFERVKTKIIPFGRGEVEITVRGFIYNEQYGGTSLNSVARVRVLHNGGVVTENSYAEVYDYPKSHPNYQEYISDIYKKHNLDTGKAYTRIKGKGKVAITEGLVGNEINEIKRQFELEIKEEYCEYRGLLSPNLVAEREAQEELEYAKAIVEQAKKIGIDNLPTRQEARERQKQYNDLFNEGGDGYVPAILTKETYEKALAKVQALNNI